MKYLIYVEFLPEGALSPEEFFARINAGWMWLDNRDTRSGETGLRRVFRKKRPRFAACITEYDSMKQLSLDLVTMPGAGIANVRLKVLSGDVSEDFTKRMNNEILARKTLSY